MEIKSNNEVLARWIKDSDSGKRVTTTSGESYGFYLKHSYTEDELLDWEEKNKINLPFEYKKFLVQVGACEIFYGGSEKRPGVIFYKLDELYELFSECFDNPKLFLFSKFLPVAADEYNQEIAAYDMEKSSPNNFFLLWHEYLTEECLDFAEEENQWGTFESWINDLIEYDGKPPI